MSRRTLHAYASAARWWDRWCAAAGIAPAFPAAPAHVVAFIGAQAGQYAPATIRRAVHALAWRHRRAAFPDPTQVSAVRDALRALSGTPGPRRWQAGRLTRADVAAIVVTICADALLATRGDRRDRALVHLSHELGAGSLQLAALTCADLVRRADGGLAVRCAWRPGRARPLSVEASRALMNWLDRAGILEGPLFRQVNRGDRVGGPLGAGAIARVISARAAAALTTRPVRPRAPLPQRLRPGTRAAVQAAVRDAVASVFRSVP